MKTKLSLRQIKECLMHYKTIANVEEMAAVLNVDLTRLSKTDYDTAARLIERNRMRLQVNLKEELYSKLKKDAKDTKSTEQLYKMICDEGELKRFGVKTVSDTTNINSTPTIEIKCADPDIIDKISNL